MLVFGKDGRKLGIFDLSYPYRSKGKFIIVIIWGSIDDLE